MVEALAGYPGVQIPGWEKHRHKDCTKWPDILFLDVIRVKPVQGVKSLFLQVPLLWHVVGQSLDGLVVYCIFWRIRPFVQRIIIMQG